jgi:chorismate synthase
MQIQAVKGVYFGENPFESSLCGSEYVGAIERSERLNINDSKSGGIDGGMTNGNSIKITVAVKPIPTTVKGVKSVDLISGEDCISAKERADTTAVFAICPILKSAVALALSEVVCERLGCDNMAKIIKRYNEL